MYFPERDGMIPEIDTLLFYGTGHNLILAKQFWKGIIVILELSLCRRSKIAATELHAGAVFSQDSP